MEEEQRDTYGVFIVSLKIDSKLFPRSVQNMNLVAVQSTQDNLHELG